MKVISLASGSDGTITYLETKEGRFLIDLGFCCSEVVRKLEFINVDPHQIDAVFITHKHDDHCKGVDVFCSKYSIPAYAHFDVWKEMDYKIKKKDRIDKKVFAYDSFTIKDLKITPFSLSHDVTCFGFSFESDNKKISILTDLGQINSQVLQAVQGSQIVFLESNYDKTMLSQNENYPLSLKRRIAGKFGHLSNDDSARICEYLVMTGTRQIVLAHLSKHNNYPSLAYETVCNYLKTKEIIEGKHVKIDVATGVPGVMFNLK